MSLRGLAKVREGIILAYGFWFSWIPFCLAELHIPKDKSSFHTQSSKSGKHQISTSLAEIGTENKLESPVLPLKPDEEPNLSLSQEFNLLGDVL